MNIKILSNYLILMTIIISLSSCGYLKDNAKGSIVDGSNVVKSCALDFKKFKKIFKEDIKSQINCIRQNLMNFSKSVRRNDQQIVTQENLSTFITNFFDTNSKSFLKSLNLLFELNQIFFNDEQGEIKVQNIKYLFETLVTFNKQSVIIAETINKLKSKTITFSQARQEISTAANNLSKGILNSIQRSGYSKNRRRKINLRKLISNISASGLTKDGTQVIDSNKVDIILKLKTILLGGKEDIITNNEVINFLHKFQKLFIVGFDLQWANRTQYFDSSYDSKIHISNALKNFYSLFYQNSRQKIIFKNSDLKKFINYLSSTDAQNEFYQNVIQSAKTYLIDNPINHSNNFTQNNLITFLDYTRIFSLSSGAFKTYKSIINQKSTSKKSKIEQSINLSNRLSVNLQNILRTNIQNFPSRIRLYQFMKSLDSHNGFFSFDVNLIDVIFSSKRLLLGGELNDLTTKELYNLFQKIPSMTNVLNNLSFRDTKISTDSVKTSADKLKNNLDLIELIRTNLTTKKQIVLSSNEILNIGKYFLPNEPFESYRTIIEEFKYNLVGGLPDLYQLKDIHSLLDISKDLLQNILFQDIQYEHNRKKLSTVKHTLRYGKHLPIQAHPYLTSYSKKDLKKYGKLFKHIYRHYKYFRNPNTKIQTWDNKYHRTKSGFKEIAAFSWIFKKLELFYTPKSQNGFSQKDVEKILNKFEPVLRAHGLWSKHIETFGRNMLLLSDLFQNSSDGNLIMSVDETTEYSILALSAMEMADNMLKYISKEDESGKYLCKNLGTEKEPAVDVQCYRSHFFDILVGKDGYKKQLPMLNSYVSSISKKNRYKFVEKIEGFAREVHDLNIPIQKRDLSRIIGAMLNVESTFVRYDLDHNNLLEPKELNQAFKVYKNGIIKVGQLTGIKEYISKSVYYYMIDKMKKPTSLQILGYIINPFDGRPTAKRMNIGVLLYYLVNQ